ncbi:hypothetical protein [Ferrimonas marina]|uniref:Uncharacterized protein n=1 Tax=Ferrimonas marina TaxID=299255 RepID=A0A1M5TFH0_9GAMM|nr:hypothetical protein [Ferrimonas marina]SHH49093.1 hypothetical protein SAMN02745129_2108 [Ferrimonas marina]
MKTLLDAATPEDVLRLIAEAQERLEGYRRENNAILMSSYPDMSPKERDEQARSRDSVGEEAAWIYLAENSLLKLKKVIDKGGYSEAVANYELEQADYGFSKLIDTYQMRYSNVDEDDQEMLAEVDDMFNEDYFAELGPKEVLEQLSETVCHLTPALQAFWLEKFMELNHQLVQTLLECVEEEPLDVDPLVEIRANLKAVDRFTRKNRYEAYPSELEEMERNPGRPKLPNTYYLIRERMNVEGLVARYKALLKADPEFKKRMPSEGTILKKAKGYAPEKRPSRAPAAPITQLISDRNKLQTELDKLKKAPEKERQTSPGGKLLGRKGQSREEKIELQERKIKEILNEIQSTVDAGMANKDARERLTFERSHLMAERRTLRSKIKNAGGMVNMATEEDTAEMQQWRAEAQNYEARIKAIEQQLA